MAGRRLIPVILAAAVCVLGAPGALAASPGRARVVATGAVHWTDTDLQTCESIALGRHARVLALVFGPRRRALLSVKIPSDRALHRAPAATSWVNLAVPDDRNWTTGPFHDGHRHVFFRGGGTVSVSAGGRMGTIEARLVGTRDAGTRYDPHAPGVHVRASWHCARIENVRAAGS